MKLELLENHVLDDFMFGMLELEEKQIELIIDTIKTHYGIDFELSDNGYLEFLELIREYGVYKVLKIALDCFELYDVNEAVLKTKEKLKLNNIIYAYKKGGE